MARGESQINIKEIFDKMEYGVKNETLLSVQKWIESNLVYIDESIEYIGKQTKFTKEPLSLGYIQLDDAPRLLIYSDVANRQWFNLDKFKRIDVLQSLASLVEENSSLFARLDAFQRNISLRDISESDVNYFVRYFRLAASMPIEISNSKRNSEWTAGNIQSAKITASIPLYEICWKIVPILINGDSVKLNVDSRAALVTLLFMKLCQKSGIPANVIRLETIDQLDINSSCYGESAAIIFDRVDVSSTVEEIIDGAYGHTGLLPWSIKRVLIQEPVYEQVKSTLFLRMGEMKSGTPFDPIANFTVSHNSSVHSEMDKIVAKIKADGFQMYQVHEKSKELLPATVVVGRPPYLLENKVSLPITTIEPFRTVEESVKLVKNSRFCRSASIWSDSHSTINKAASLLMDETDVQTVWLNVHGQLDPAVPFLLSNDQHGVKEDLLAYILEQSLPELKIMINPETPDILSRVNGNEVSASNIDGTVKSAMKAQKEWYHFGAVKRSSVLSKVAFKLKSCFNEHSVLRKEAGTIGDGILESLMEFVMKISVAVQSLKFTSVNTTGGDLVLINCKPCGVMFLDVVSIRNVIEFIKLVVSYVAFGNALIIATDKDSLINEVQHIFKTCGACTNIISLIKTNDNLSNSNDNTKTDELSQSLDVLTVNCLIMKTAWSSK